MPGVEQNGVKQETPCNCLPHGVTREEKVPDEAIGELYEATDDRFGMPAVKRRIRKLTLNSEQQKSFLEHLQRLRELAIPGLELPLEVLRADANQLVLLEAKRESADLPNGVAPVDRREEALAGADSLLGAVQALHRAGLTHGLIQPKRVVRIAAGGGQHRLALADAALGCLPERTNNGLCDSTQQAYRAKNVTNGAPKAHDLFALGKTLDELCHGKLPAKRRGWFGTAWHAVFQPRRCALQCLVRKLTENPTQGIDYIAKAYRKDAAGRIRNCVVLAIMVGLAALGFAVILAGAYGRNSDLVQQLSSKDSALSVATKNLSQIQSEHQKMKKELEILKKPAVPAPVLKAKLQWLTLLSKDPKPFLSKSILSSGNLSGEALSNFQQWDRARLEILKNQAGLDWIERNGDPTLWQLLIKEWFINPNDIALQKRALERIKGLNAAAKRWRKWSNQSGVTIASLWSEAETLSELERSILREWLTDLRDNPRTYKLTHKGPNDLDATFIAPHLATLDVNNEKLNRTTIVWRVPHNGIPVLKINFHKYRKSSSILNEVSYGNPLVMWYLAYDQSRPYSIKINRDLNPVDKAEERYSFKVEVVDGKSPGPPIDLPFRSLRTK